MQRGQGKRWGRQDDGCGEEVVWGRNRADGKGKEEGIG